MVGCAARVVAPLFLVVGMIGKRDRQQSRDLQKVTTIRDADGDAGEEQARGNE